MGRLNNQVIDKNNNAAALSRKKESADGQSLPRIDNRFQLVQTGHLQRTAVRVVSSPCKRGGQMATLFTRRGSRRMVIGCFSSPHFRSASLPRNHPTCQGAKFLYRYMLKLKSVYRFIIYMLICSNAHSAHSRSSLFLMRSRSRRTERSARFSWTLISLAVYPCRLNSRIARSSSP